MPDDSWKYETMHDLRTDSPYYWEMRETEREHQRWLDQIRADQLAEDRYEADEDIDEDDDEE